MYLTPIRDRSILRYNWRNCKQPCCWRMRIKEQIKHELIQKTWNLQCIKLYLKDLSSWNTYALSFDTYFLCMSIWWKSSFSSYSGQWHTAIKRIRTAAWRKDNSPSTEYSQLSYPRGGKTFEPVLHYRDPGEERSTSFNPKWVSYPILQGGLCFYSLIIHDLYCKVRSQPTLGPHLHHNYFCGFICPRKSKWEEYVLSSGSENDVLFQALIHSLTADTKAQTNSLLRVCVSDVW